MKTVLITISRGSIARNLLQNNFYSLLKSSYRVIILTPSYNDKRFIKEFSAPNVTFLPLKEVEHNFFDRLFFFFHKYLIYNYSVNLKSRWGTVGDARTKEAFYPFYILRKIIFLPLSKIGFLRDLVRWLDYLFLQKEEVKMFKDLLKKEKIDLAVVTNIASDSEAAIIKAAKKLKIQSLGFPKSWDNLSKHGFRAKADTLAVWNDFMKEQAVRFHNYSPEKVEIVGIPQFDSYREPNRLLSREDFSKLYGLDPNSVVILFGSEGKLFPSDADIVSILDEFISKGELAKKTSLIIRPHYGYKDDEKKFLDFRGKPNVALDLYNNPSSNFRDHWDYSEDFSNRFANCLYHSDIMINTASTLSLDAVAFDKPVINISFDGRNIKPYNRSIARWYETDYYRAILKTQATSVVSSSDELKSAINKYMTDSSFKAGERENLRERFCYKLDGKSGQRLYDLIEQKI